MRRSYLAPSAFATPCFQQLCHEPASFTDRVARSCFASLMNTFSLRAAALVALRRFTQPPRVRAAALVSPRCSPTSVRAAALVAPLSHRSRRRARPSHRSCLHTARAAIARTCTRCCRARRFGSSRYMLWSPLRCACPSCLATTSMLVLGARGASAPSGNAAALAPARPENYSQGGTCLNVPDFRDLFAHFEARCRLLRFPPLRHEPFARCRFPSGTFTQTKYRQVPHTGCY